MTTPRALFFGSIGTIVETSELQRQAYNLAFRDLDVACVWDVNTYRSLLTESGGMNRLQKVFDGRLNHNLLKNIHEAKEKFYSDLVKAGLQPRPGVRETIQRCKRLDVKLAWVTTTSRQNINSILNAIPDLSESDFSFVTDSSTVVEAKPHPAIYRYALDKVGVLAGEALAIEDTAISLQAPVSLNIPSYLFLGDYASIEGSQSAAVVDDLESISLV